MKILAIESSCDETAASVVETDGFDVKILSNVIASQIDIHKQFGGVFPEKASRAHAEKIIQVASEALGNIDPDLIAVTVGPGLIGSLLIGVNFAKTYAYANKLPIIGVNHWLGHIYSNWATDYRIPSTENTKTVNGQRSTVNLPSFPALILIVSGGHTGLVLMKSHTDIQPLGQTLDDAAGEAFDKVAKILGLDYPGGPAIAAEAARCHSVDTAVVIPAKAGIQSDLDSKSCRRPVWNDKIKLPRPMIDSKNYNFSFSGLKTAVLNETRKLQAQGIALDQYQSLVACEFQQATIDVLISKTMAAAYEYKPKSICLCGGVSANKELREQMQKVVSMLPWKASYHVPEPILSTDNAAMIGIAASYHLDKMTGWNNINANANLKL